MQLSCAIKSILTYLLIIQKLRAYYGGIGMCKAYIIYRHHHNHPQIKFYNISNVSKIKLNASEPFRPKINKSNTLYTTTEGSKLRKTA